ncbi:uncharacterized protein LOC116246745 isoform X2 [Nymphaea colorata]|uniref:uncharacterized protein LOC116246745 isoform X2 n=1 Tax=Nymphaea colorata TaxID=210225 RepID=UPI00129D4E31|nr:uncharacterized protein LOC116246745 isoform X2 [Nymphaea colorata]
MAGLQKREFRGENIDGRQRPLMLKDFLNNTNSLHVSKKRRRHRRSSSESPTTMGSPLEMESERNKRILQGSGIVSKQATTTPSALRKASEVLVKILPCSICTPSQHAHGTTILRGQSMAPMRECHSLKGSFSRRLSAVMRSLSHRSHHNKREAEIQVRVRDIMRWTSSGDEEIMHNEYCNSKALSQNEAHLQIPDRTLDSFSSSRTSSCTWSECGQESDGASNLHSSSDSSVCSGGADGLKDEMHLLNYHSKKEDRVATEEGFKLECFERPKADIPIESLGFNPAVGMPMSGGGLDSLDRADTHCCDGQEADVQQHKRAGHGCNECDVERFHEKEQFSPLSVLDFPFEDEATATFVESIPNIRRIKQQLLQNCQNETVAELDPVDLNKCFESFIFEFPVEDSEDFAEHYDGNSGDYLDSVVEIEDVEECIMEVLNQYMNATQKRRWGSFGSLVIDVFKEESSFGSQLNADQLVKAVTGRIKEWLVKGNEMDENREVPLKEMDINQYWKGFGIDDEMAAEMEVAVFRFLVDELLFDIMDSKAFASGRI